MAEKIKDVIPESGGGTEYTETYDPRALLQEIEGIEGSAMKRKLFRIFALKRARNVLNKMEASRHLSEGDKALYIGCGSGHVAQTLEKQSGADMFKIDLTDFRFQDTRDDKFVLGNARELPIADESLDAACLVDVVHHTEGQEEVLREAIRTLKPGGKLLLLEDNIPPIGDAKRETKMKVTAAMDDKFNKQGEGVNPHGYRNISEWKEMLENLGLKVDEENIRKWKWGIPHLFAPNAMAIYPRRPFEMCLLVGEKPGGECAEE